MEMEMEVSSDVWGPGGCFAFSHVTCLAKSSSVCAYTYALYPLW